MNYFKVFLMKAFCGYVLMLLSFVSISYAEDFTYNVPVEINNLHPDLKVGQISCSLINKTSEMIGKGSANFDIVNGNYSGTVVVKFNTSIPSNNVNAYKWACALYLSKNYLPTPNDIARDVTKIGGPYPRDTSKPFKDYTEGMIPVLFQTSP
jgi:hypothetical protein